MINLLPTPMKKQLRAARANTLLFRYTVMLAASAVFLGITIVAVYIVMSSIRSNAEQAMAENQAKISNYAAIEAEAVRFRANLATAKTILGKEVVYSKAIVSIAQAIPSGVVLDNLSLDSKTFGTPTTLTARTKSYDAAIKLKNTLEASDVFSDVHFSSISSADTVEGSGNSGEGNDYPYSVSINLTINKGIAAR